MTLSELITELQDLADQAGDYDPTIMIATQPSWPMEEAVSQVVMSDPMEGFYEDYGHEPPEDDDSPAQDHYQLMKEQALQQERKVYFAGGFSNNYLQEGMASALGWR